VYSFPQRKPLSITAFEAAKSAAEQYDVLRRSQAG
jgi:hypothetical protein